MPLLIDAISQATIWYCTYVPGGKFLIAAFAYLMQTPVMP